jgi:hypothetical protein
MEVDILFANFICIFFFFLLLLLPVYVWHMMLRVLQCGCSRSCVITSWCLVRRGHPEEKGHLPGPRERAVHPGHRQHQFNRPVRLPVSSRLSRSQITQFPHQSDSHWWVNSHFRLTFGSGKYYSQIIVDKTKNREILLYPWIPIWAIMPDSAGSAAVVVVRLDVCVCTGVEGVQASRPRNLAASKSRPGAMYRELV